MGGLLYELLCNHAFFLLRNMHPRFYIYSNENLSADAISYPISLPQLITEKESDFIMKIYTVSVCFKNTLRVYTISVCFKNILRSLCTYFKTILQMSFTSSENTNVILFASYTSVTCRTKYVNARTL